jgi:hypothetical protein
LEILKVNEPNGALRAIYSKYKRVAGEIALLLYLFDLAFTVDSVDGVLTGVSTDILPFQFMQKGIDLAKRYIQEVKSIYLQNQGIVDGGLSPIFAKLIELSKRKGFITARDVKVSSRLLKNKSVTEIRDLFTDLVSMGYGKLKGEGNFMQWSVDSVDGVLTPPSTPRQHPQSIDMTESENIKKSSVDVLTQKTKFSESNIYNSTSVYKIEEKNISKASTVEELESENITEPSFEGVDGGVNTASTVKGGKVPQSTVKSGVDRGSTETSTASTVSTVNSIEDLKPIIELGNMLGYDFDILTSIGYDYFGKNELSTLSLSEIEKLRDELTERAKSRKLI